MYTTLKACILIDTLSLTYTQERYESLLSTLKNKLEYHGEDSFDIWVNEKIKGLSATYYCVQLRSEDSRFFSHVHAKFKMQAKYLAVRKMITKLEILDSCPSVTLEKYCLVNKISLPVYRVEYSSRHTTDIVCTLNQFRKEGSGSNYDIARERAAFKMYRIILYYNRQTRTLY
ncbi:uncharacterized protein LOC126844205 isoform X2 [Adelges cooleyi]|uniref:uncharacterized protein LOC126844205 isoform X2 n=1 Tax=Adelges cooleyi TaxID=133065 RepID=UPI0021801DB7|nr:uncharacterized protein LOC126844205 isoform X2 [Adelges cooleyi]